MVRDVANGRDGVSPQNLSANGTPSNSCLTATHDFDERSRVTLARRVPLLSFSQDKA